MQELLEEAFPASEFEPVSGLLRDGASPFSTCASEVHHGGTEDLSGLRDLRLALLFALFPFHCVPEKG